MCKNSLHLLVLLACMSIENGVLGNSRCDRKLCSWYWAFFIFVLVMECIDIRTYISKLYSNGNKTIKVNSIFFYLTISITTTTH